MIRQKTISSLTSILMIVIFLASIVCNSIAVGGWSSLGTHDVIGVNKKTSIPAKSDKQLPEKVEVENDVKSNDHFFFIHEFGGFIPFNITKSQSAFIHNAFRYGGNTSRTPLFLIKRTILI